MQRDRNLTEDTERAQLKFADLKGGIIKIVELERGASKLTVLRNTPTSALTAIRWWLTEK